MFPKFWYVMFFFPFISKFFIITLMIFFLIHWSLKNVLFNFHKFVIFSSFLLLATSNFILFCSENTLSDPCLLKLAEIYVLAAFVSLVCSRRTCVCFLVEHPVTACSVSLVSIELSLLFPHTSSVRWLFSFLRLRY